MAKVKHTIKDPDGKPIAPESPIDPDVIGSKRFQRLIEKGRVTDTGAQTLTNRAEESPGRPSLKLPPPDDD